MALHFTGHDLARVIRFRPEARGYRFEFRGNSALESVIVPDYLGDDSAASG